MPIAVRSGEIEMVDANVQRGVDRPLGLLVTD
jgi:hypothetical protein